MIKKTLLNDNPSVKFLYINSFKENDNYIYSYKNTGWAGYLSIYKRLDD